MTAQTPPHAEPAARYGQAGGDSRPSFPGIKRRGLFVEGAPVDPFGQPHQFVAQVDDLIKAGAEQVVGGGGYPCNSSDLF
jgi:hypothetical protein